MSDAVWPYEPYEWVAMPSSRGCSCPRDQTWISYTSCIAGEPLEKPQWFSVRLKHVSVFPRPQQALYKQWLWLSYWLPLLSLLSILATWLWVYLSESISSFLKQGYKNCHLGSWEVFHIKHLAQWGSQVTLVLKNLPANAGSIRETWVWSLGWEDPLEEGMTTHSSVLAWRTPWTEKSGGLQSIGLHRVRHNWSDFAPVHTLHCVHLSVGAKLITILFSPLLFPHSHVSPAPRPREVISVAVTASQWSG